MDLSVTVLGLQTFLIGSFSRTGDKYSLSLEAKLCSSLFMTCLPAIEVLSDIKFPAVRPKGIASFPLNTIIFSVLILLVHCIFLFFIIIDPLLGPAAGYVPLFKFYGKIKINENS